MVDEEASCTEGRGSCPLGIRGHLRTGLKFRVTFIVKNTKKTVFESDFKASKIRD